jgi:WD40 repeat protein
LTYEYEGKMRVGFPSSPHFFFFLDFFPSTSLSVDVLHVEWSPDERHLASSSVDNTIIIWSTPSFGETEEEER